MRKSLEKELAYIRGKLEIPTEELNTPADWKNFQKSLLMTRDVVEKSSFGIGNKELKETVLLAFDLYEGVMAGVIEIIERDRERMCEPNAPKKPYP